MKTQTTKVVPLICLAFLVSSCATTASQSAKNAGDDHLNPVKQLNTIPYPSGPFEGPQNYKVSDLLPQNMIFGKNHSIDRNVLNDGYLFLYTINSSYGKIRAVSTAMVYKRIQEINAIAKIENKSKLKEFGGGVYEKGKDVVAGAYTLVTSPVDTVTNAVSGVGKIFKRVGENVFEQSRSDAEDNRLKSVIGFAKTKRDYAYDMNIDVYSRNPLLQDSLDNLTWSGYSGNMAMALTVSAFTGPITTSIGTTNLLNKVFRDTAPADLRIMNRKKLQKMSVSEKTIDLFIENGMFTPKEQTTIVSSLDAMKSTADRSAFIKFATRTNDPDVAFFRQRQAEMYSNFNRVYSPVSRFIGLGTFVGGLTSKNNLVLCLPLDHVLWTADIAKAATFLSHQASSKLGLNKKQLVLAGTASPLAKQKLKALGWTISERMF